jgi:DeoR/GlpR family transcriptional regulator of sugar metabolism
MLKMERQGALLARLRAERRASVDELAAGLSVTPSTIRRDLAELAEGGRLIRTYGGAALAEPRPDRGPIPNAAAKEGIAVAAADLAEDGQTIVIASGTTTLAFARRLVDRRLTVITNALDVAAVLIDRPGIELVILGGVVRPRMHSMLGHLAELAARELRADAVFMGIGAISRDGGLMNDSIPEILTDRALRRIARTVVILADASKFDQVAPAFVFGLDEVDVLVTDSAARPQDIAALEAHGVRVVVAGEPPRASEGSPDS